MLTLFRFHRLCLRYKLSFIFCIIVRPTMYFGNFARPVTMPGVNRCCPLQCSRPPWILGCHFPAFEDRIEKVEYKHQLNRKHDHCYRGNKFIEITELVKRFPAGIIKITTRHTCQSCIVHRPENKIGSYHRYPEMDICHCIVQVTAIHFRKPVINSCEHPEKSCNPHYDMEVSHYEISIV